MVCRHVNTIGIGVLRLVIHCDSSWFSIDLSWRQLYANSGKAFRKITNWFNWPFSEHMATWWILNQATPALTTIPPVCSPPTTSQIGAMATLSFCSAKTYSFSTQKHPNKGSKTQKLTNDKMCHMFCTDIKIAITSANRPKHGKAWAQFTQRKG